MHTLCSKQIIQIYIKNVFNNIINSLISVSKIGSQKFKKEENLILNKEMNLLCMPIAQL